MAKYVKAHDVDVRAFRGDTIKKLTDRIRFDGVEVKGYSRILIHVGTNDIINMVDSGKHRDTTVFDLIDRYHLLRDTIRRRNSKAVLIFSAILPILNRYKLFRGYIRGLNFALEKWCAKSRGVRVFIPSFNAFIARGRPKAALYAESDGLHLSGAGVDLLESILQQALSTGYLLTRVRSDKVRELKCVRY